MILNKIYPTKQAIRNILKNIDISESLELNYSKSNTFVIKKIEKNLYRIDVLKTPLNPNQHEIDISKLKTDIIQVNLTSLMKILQFTKRFYFVDISDDIIAKYNEWNKKDITQTTANLKKQDVKLQDVNNYFILENLYKNFYKKYLEINQKYFEKIKNNEIKDNFKNKFRTDEELNMRDERNELYWDIIVETFKSFNIDVKTKKDNKYFMEFEILNQKYTFGMYKFVNLNNQYSHPTYETGKYIDYKNYNDPKNMNFNQKNHGTNISSFIRFEYVRSDFLDYSSIWDKLSIHNHRNIISVNKFSHPYNLVFRKTRSIQTYEMFEKFFRLLIEQYKLDNDIKLKDLGKIKNKEYDKNRIIYVTDNDFKTVIDNIVISEYFIEGTFYDKITKTHVNGKWFKHSLEPFKGTNINLLKYKFRQYKFKNFDWSILPKDINMLFRDENIDTWAGSSQYRMDFNRNTGHWTNGVMQKFELDLNDKYNFEIIDFPENLTFQKKNFESIDTQKIAEENGNTQCYCGNEHAKPMIWNGKYQGHMCHEHYMEFAYDNTMTFQ